LTITMTAQLDDNHDSLKRKITTIPASRKQPARAFFEQTLESTSTSSAVRSIFPPAAMNSLEHFT